MEDSVPPEPIADCGEKLCTMRIRFPDGTTEQRRFLAEHRLKVSRSPPKCLNRILPLLLLLLGLDELFWCKRILSFRLQNSHRVSKERCMLLLHYERPLSSIPLSFTHTSLTHTYLSLIPPTSTSLTHFLPPTPMFFSPTPLQLTALDEGQTLEEAGLCPQETLFLEER